MKTIALTVSLSMVMVEEAVANTWIRVLTRHCSIDSGMSRCFGCDQAFGGT